MKDYIFIVFRKNFVLGKVKTRIAKDSSDEIALEIYKSLCNISEELYESENYNTQIYFSDFIPNQASHFLSVIQQGNDLGIRMANAFQKNVKQGSKVILIGTDCPYIKRSDIDSAFCQLDNSDLIIGPCKDGGYYLIGLKSFYPELFSGIQWSTSEVFQKTIEIAKSLNLNVSLLPEYEDIDSYQNWLDFLKSKSYG
ncbi:MAG: glycosyltransferase [Saprospiraceae bacterium]|nr:glycosyltransferase [Saprospiraceae bacterium]